MELQQEQGRKKGMKKTRWGRIIGIVAGVIVITFLAVSYVRITTEARLVFREAKNLRLAFQMLEIESHGSGKHYYDFSRKSGLAEGVLEQLKPFMGEGGQVRLTGYNGSSHRVTGFVYTQGNYMVTYTCDQQQKEHWSVDVCWSILRVDEE